MAKVLGAINPDTFHGQALSDGGQIQVWPFTDVTDGDTLTLPTAANPTGVAWQPTAATDIVAVTMHATTKVVTFNTAGVTTLAGNLLVFCGGNS